jgi:hypothetical protein
LISNAQDNLDARTVLNGNWHQTGPWGAPSQSPRLILSLGVNGDKVYGEGDLQANCSMNNAEYGSKFIAEGRIMPDGTFLLESDVSKTSSADTYVIRLKGKAQSPELRSGRGALTSLEYERVAALLEWWEISSLRDYLP